MALYAPSVVEQFLCIFMKKYQQIWQVNDWKIW